MFYVTIKKFININFIQTKIFNLAPVFLIGAFVFVFFPTSITAQSDKSSQEKTASKEEYDSTLELLKNLNHDNKDATDKARKEIEMRWESIKPILVLILKKEKSCTDISTIAGLMIDIDDNNEIAVPALVSTAKERNVFSNEEDLMCRRNAAFLLGFSSYGIRELITLLKNDDVFVRRSAAFAFEDLTEANIKTISKDGRLEALKEAIPSLKVATKDKDKIVRGVAEEALEQGESLIRTISNIEYLSSLGLTNTPPATQPTPVPSPQSSILVPERGVTPLSPKPPGSAVLKSATPYDILKASQTIYIRSYTGNFEAFHLVNALNKKSQLSDWGLSLVDEVDLADLILTIDQVPLTWKFTFSISSQRAGVTVATGSVIVWDGNLGADRMADRVIEKLKKVMTDGDKKAETPKVSQGDKDKKQNKDKKQDKESKQEKNL